MEILARGTPLETDDVVAPGAQPGSPIIIERGLGECPHGFWYQARQDDVPLLVTVLDPILVAQPDLRAQVARDIERGRHVSHRNLLPCHGLGTAGLRSFTAEAWPGGGTVREFARGRREHGHELDLGGAYTLVAHVCNGLVALHEQLVHGYVTLDTVHVTEEGRVLLGAIGIGATLPRTRGFSRFRFGGLLPNIAPEQVLLPAKLTMATDVFGVAAMFLELVTGQSLVEAGQPLRDLGFRGSPALTECLERATDPDPEQRQPDLAELKAELAAALRAEGVQTNTRPPGQLDEGLRAAIAQRLASPPLEIEEDDWSDFTESDETTEESPAPKLERGVPPPPHFTGAPEPIPDDDDDGAAGPPGYPYPPGPGGPPGYPPPPEHGAGPPGYSYPPGYPYPPPGYPYPPPGYPYPPPGYPYPPPGAYPYPYPPPGYPPYGAPAPYGAPPPGAPAAPGPPGTSPPGYGAPAQPAPPEKASPLRPGMSGFDPEAARRQMDELDRATRRIAGIDADSALREYTEHVGDGESRFDLDDDVDPVSERHESSSGPLLGLEVDAYEDAAERLSMLDGAEDTETAKKATGPTQSGTFFSSFSDEPARPKADPDADPETRWYVVRDGKDYGPYSVTSLSQMIRTGRVRSVDTLRSEGTGRESMTVDVPALRPACEERRAHEDKQPRARPGEERPGTADPPKPAAAVAEPRPPARGRSPWLVMMIVAVLVAGLGIAGFLLSRG